MGTSENLTYQGFDVFGEVEWSVGCSQIDQESEVGGESNQEIVSRRAVPCVRARGLVA